LYNKKGIMSAITYLTQLVQQAISKLNLIETNSKKIEELPFQTTLDPNSKIAVSRSGETEHVNIQQIISAINNDNYNHLISVGAISVDEMTNELTIGATVEAMINNITVSKSTDTIFPITLSDTGLIRKDIFFINSLGNVLIISGVEGAIATTPILPLDSVYITEILVNDSSIGSPVDAIIGDAFVKKISSGAITTMISGIDVSFPFPASGKTFLTFNNPALTSLAGFNLSEIIGVVGAEVPEEGKEFIIVNNKNTTLTLQYLNTDNADNLPFWWRSGADIVVPPFEFLRIKYFASGTKDLDRSWITATSTPFSGLTGSPSDNAALTSVLNDKADKSDTYTKTEVDSKLSAVYIFKGNVANFAALPSSGQKVGWTYNLLDTGDNYAWDGSDWDKLSGVVDISGKEDVSNKSNSDTDFASTSKFPTWNAIWTKALSYFQAILVSGTNIKTLNGNSILGSGDLVVGGGGSLETILNNLGVYVKFNQAATSHYPFVGAQMSSGVIQGADTSLITKYSNAHVRFIAVGSNANSGFRFSDGNSHPTSLLEETTFFAIVCPIITTNLSAVIGMPASNTINTPSEILTTGAWFSISGNQLQGKCAFGGASTAATAVTIIAGEWLLLCIEVIENNAISKRIRFKARKIDGTLIYNEDIISNIQSFDYYGGMSTGMRAIRTSGTSDTNIFALQSMGFWASKPSFLTDF
tara:strand:+ start:46668 stop:48764 length:2097 start_codon:yes stop_codon:yes gene_type:complete